MTVARGATSSSTSATGPSTSHQPGGPPVQTEAGEAPPTGAGGVLQYSVKPVDIARERGRAEPAGDNQRAQHLAAFPMSINAQ
jgi:hypothetical protein